MAGGNPNPSKRGRVVGWSAAAVRRHTAWLWSIDAPALDGQGIAFTLTMRDCPADHEELLRIRGAWLDGLRDAGALRWHWVVEWTRRGVPHIHAAVYYPEGSDAAALAARAVVHWIGLSAQHGAGIPGQWTAPIHGAEGWLEYLSKHAARGVRHYQRAGKPAGWETTGRLWGYGRSWPVDAPMRFRMDAAAFWRYRRLVRAWRVADARSRPLARSQQRAGVVVSARRMLACPLPKLSAVRGVSEWVPESVQLDLIALLIAEGHEVTQASPSLVPAVS